MQPTSSFAALPEHLGEAILATLNEPKDLLVKEGMLELQILTGAPGFSVDELILQPPSERPLVADVYNSTEALWIELCRISRELLGFVPMDEAGLRVLFGQNCRRELHRHSLQTTVD